MKKKTTMVLAPVLAVGVAFGVNDLSPKAATVTEIERGDTLWGVSQEYGVTVDHLLEVNPNVDPYALPIGSEIYVERSSEDSSEGNGEATTYTIQPDDTLWSIAQQYGVTVDQIIDLNEGLNVRSLQIGSDISLATEDNEANHVYHTIQPGNTLSEIASVYDGVTVRDIIVANPDVEPYALQIGSQLLIPVQ
ncbi:LysM peptidoglycan-binding domain-containing protein [Alkalihalobacterium sp. APHAB7]|uniref:LysM peptidoglycan-binding domain-containing protein n=1 Tax=Alkalihalobacterium sp. APHAB7 TaxID=3402081 RepID=UPI003AACFB53